MASDLMRPIVGYCGHTVGTLGGPILVSVRCEECDDYVGTYWGDEPPPGYPALIGAVRDDDGDEVDVWRRDGAVLVTVTDDGGRSTAKLSGERLAAVRELLDRAAMPGQEARDGG